MEQDLPERQTRAYDDHPFPEDDGRDKTASDRMSELSLDPEMEGLTLYEKKALLVNRELDRQGMGKYQWMIFFLCGFGYFLDLLWAQAFGLVISPIQLEFGFADAELGNILTSFSAGLTAGAFVWGVLVDIIGRYWAFNFTVLISSIFGLVVGASNNYNTVLVLTAFIGIGIGGNIPIDTTIVVECLPQGRRWLLPTLSIFQPLGVVVCSALAYGLIPKNICSGNAPSCHNVNPGEPCCTKSENYGWRYLLFTLGAITMGVFFLRFIVFRFQESPKFLLYRGQDEKAIKVLQYIAKYNRRDCQLTLESFNALTSDASSTSSADTDRSRAPVLGSGKKQSDATLKEKFSLELQRYKYLFSSFTMARFTVLVWIIYMWDYWGFTIAGGFLPTVLLRKNVELGISLTTTYRNYIIIYIFGIPGVLLGTSIYKFRYISLLVSSALFGACLFIFTAVHDQASYIGINGLVYFFQSMFNAILYGWTPEGFPAPVRGTACGVASFWGRIFSIVAPIAAGRVLADGNNTNGVLYLAGGGVFVSTVAIALLPRKYLGSQSY
jgi:MFS family permease